MKARHLLIPAMLLASFPTAPAQGTTELNTNTPLWLRELSNLPADQRHEYTFYFKRAKETYAQARISECLSYLNSCELIYNKNPNVWSLRASALIAQRNFDEAKPLISKVLAVQPYDSICLFNNSLICLGEGRYQDCLDDALDLLSGIRNSESMALIHSLKFRILLCYLMLDREEEARQVVEDLTALDDSPLYYYAQAAFAVYKKDAEEAKRNIIIADRIYAGDKYLLSYKQNFSFSGLEKKFLGKEEEEKEATSGTPLPEDGE